MSERSTRSKDALKLLREQRGPELAVAQARLKEQVKIAAELTRLLRERPMTVPDLAAAASLPTETVFWHLMAMRKYGKVVEGEQAGDYFQYRLV